MINEFELSFNDKINQYRHMIERREGRESKADGTEKPERTDST